MADEKEMLLAEIKTQVASEFQTRNFQSKQDVEAAVEEKMKSIKDLPLDALRAYQQDKEDMKKLINDQKAALEAQGLELRAIKESQQKAIPDRKTIASQIRAAIEKDKAGWERFKNRESNSFGQVKGDAAIAVETRAAATMTIAGSTGSSVFVPTVEVLPGMVDLARNKPFLENYANTTNTGSSRIVWTEKTNPQGSAAFIGEGGLKPLISFEITTRESFAKKVADKIKVSTEMLDDVDFIAGEIENELRYQVDIKVDAELLAGAGDGTVGATTLKGLGTAVGGYALTTVKTTSPNNYDAIRAAIAQIVSLNFSPNTLFINPIDSANMDLVKDTQGRPLAMEYKDGQGRIYRLQPVETNQVPQGKVLIGDMSRFKIRNYQPFSIAYGWVNDDFEKNLVTVIGERRLHAFLAANEVGAFVYDTFANIKTAITAA
jgi:HK97 family phage major capsid protein